MIEYKLNKSGNKHSRYPYVIIKSYPGFFNYYHCTQADVDMYKHDLPALYQASKDNG